MSVSDNLAATLLVTVFLIIVATSVYTNVENFTSTGEQSSWDKVLSDRGLTESELKGSLYSPIICRPPEVYSVRYNKSCKDPLYPSNEYGKSEMSRPCSPENEAKYYAKRPILNSGKYYSMLETLLKSIRDPIPMINNAPLNVSSLKYPQEFSDSYQEIMNAIMNRIEFAKNNLPLFQRYAKDDTWSGEQFAYWNVKVFAFSEEKEGSEQNAARNIRYNVYKGPRRYIVTFTLHNTLRTLSTDLVALLYEASGKISVNRIEFATIDMKYFSKKEIPKPSNKEEDITGSNVPQWIYGNTLEHQTFNEIGYHDPIAKRNILIEGGVPREYEKVLNECEQSFLMNCGSANDLPGGSNPGEVYPNLPSRDPAWKVV